MLILSIGELQVASTRFHILSMVSVSPQNIIVKSNVAFWLSSVEFLGN